MFALLLMLIGIGSAYFFVSMQKNFLHLKLAGTAEQAQGTIKDIAEREDFPHNGLFMATVSFENATGQTKTFTEQAGKRQPLYAPGQEVTVLYDESGEKLIAIIANNQAASLFIALMAPLVFFLFNYAAMKMLQQAKLAADNRPSKSLPL